MLTSSTSPTRTVIRNGGTHRFGARISSTTITTRSTRTAAGVLARSVTIDVAGDHEYRASFARPPTFVQPLVPLERNRGKARPDREGAGDGDRQRERQREPGGL